MNAADKDKIRSIAEADGGIAPRLPFPQACLDGAFLECMEQALGTPELLEQFDRLYGASLSGRRTPIEQMVDKATGKLQDDARAFANFVHDGIYLRLEDEAIYALRVKHLTKQNQAMGLYEDGDAPGGAGPKA